MRQRAIPAFFVLLALFFAVMVTAQGEEAETAFYTSMPEDLFVTQRVTENKPNDYVVVRKCYPTSNNGQVNLEIRALVDEMTEAAMAFVPAKPKSTVRMEIGPVISRTGTSWMSFLTLAEVVYQHEQLSVDLESRVYDMATGERIALTDVFASESEAWALLAEGVRAQLSAAFPEEEPDGAALDALCSAESLQNAAFSLGAARLVLTFRADAIYPGKTTLLHAIFYYPEIRPLMTARAQAQTDNSRFRMVALTFDDGPYNAKTRSVLDKLRNYAAQATFFIVGETIHNNHDTLSREQDAMHSIQTHTYTHIYDPTLEQALEEKEHVYNELSALTGVPPTLMRAPGGGERFYVTNSIGYPLIHWSLPAGDSGSSDVERVANRVMYVASDGDIVLMHDTNQYCTEYAELIVEHFNLNGILCVTVEELFADAGVALEPNVVYYSPTDIR